MVAGTEPSCPPWGWLKYDRLRNHVPHDAAEPNGRVVDELRMVEDNLEFSRGVVRRLGSSAAASITFLTSYWPTPLCAVKGGVSQWVRVPPGQLSRSGRKLSERRRR
jgi:hypothetical protein